MPEQTGHAASLVDCPCIFCGYNGPRYWQAGTHNYGCLWYRIGGREERLKSLPGEIDVLAAACAGAADPMPGELKRLRESDKQWDLHEEAHRKRIKMTEEALAEVTNLNAELSRLRADSAEMRGLLEEVLGIIVMDVGDNGRKELACRIRALLDKRKD